MVLHLTFASARGGVIDSRWNTRPTTIKTTKNDLPLPMFKLRRISSAPAVIQYPDQGSWLSSQSTLRGASVHSPYSLTFSITHPQRIVFC